MDMGTRDVLPIGTRIRIKDLEYVKVTCPNCRSVTRIDVRVLDKLSNGKRCTDSKGHQLTQQEYDCYECQFPIRIPQEGD